MSQTQKECIINACKLQYGLLQLLQDGNEKGIHKLHELTGLLPNYLKQNLNEIKTLSWQK